MAYYTAQTFGSSNQRVASFRRSLDAAIKDALSLVGSGSVTTVRVYEHDTRALAMSADISAVRDGERIVYQA